MRWVVDSGAHRRLPLASALLVLALWPGLARAEVSAADRKLVAEVGQRLLAVMDRPEGYETWPPAFEVLDDPRPNADALADRKNPRITVNRGEIMLIANRQPEVLAFTLAHELGHLHYHHQPREKTLTGLVFSREQEIRADRFGMALALKANYPYAALRKNLILSMRKKSRYSAIEGLSSTHPAWSERGGLLDEKNRTLWHALGAFENGRFFLLAEHYAAAASCFRQALEDFPQSCEAHANRGYALLMQYCDALTVQDLRTRGLGQVATADFYEWPKRLEQQASPEPATDCENVPLWEEAVGEMKAALKLRADLRLVQLHLGLAYLMRPQARGGRDPAQALRYFQAAAQPGSPGLTPSEHVAVRINSAVARLAAGQVEEGQRALAEAESSLTRQAAGGGNRALDALLRAALHYNQALLLARSADAGTRLRAARLFETYLRTSAPESSWWLLAREQYLRLCRELKRSPRPPRELKRQQPRPFRPILGVEGPDGLRLTLGDSLPDVEARLGAARTSLPVARGSRFRRLCYPSHGLDLLATDHLVAIVLRGPQAPPLLLKPTGIGAAGQLLRVGMRAEDLEKVLGEPPPFEELTGPNEVHRYYRCPGIGVRVRKGKVAEIVVAQLPRQIAAGHGLDHSRGPGKGD